MMLTLKKSYKGSFDLTDVEEDWLRDDELKEMIKLLLAVQDEILLQISLVNLR